ncbi:MAG: hypothetical protein ACLRZ6_08315 [Lachnospiraceae bacterium]
MVRIGETVDFIVGNDSTGYTNKWKMLGQQYYPELDEDSNNLIYVLSRSPRMDD